MMYFSDLTQLIKDTVLVKRSHTTIPPTEMNRVAPGITMYPPPPTSGLPNTVPAHNTAPGAGLNRPAGLLCSVEGPGITVYPPPPTSGLLNTTPPHTAAGSSRQNVAADLPCSVEGPGITVYPPPPTSGLPNTTPPHNTTAAAGLNRHNVAPSPLCSVGSAEQHESAVFKVCKILCGSVIFWELFSRVEYYFMNGLLLFSQNFPSRPYLSNSCEDCIFHNWSLYPSLENYRDDMVKGGCGHKLLYTCTNKVNNNKRASKLLG